jgi:hypothetical protein
VEEYYLYDPEKCRLQGWLREQINLREIVPINDWVSPRLGIRFVLDSSGLQIYRPDGQRFLTSIELDAQFRQEKQRAEMEKQRADKLAKRLQELGIDLTELL